MFLVSATFAHEYVTNAPVCSFTCANAATCALALATAPTGTLLWSYVCSQR